MARQDRSYWVGLDVNLGRGEDAAQPADTTRFRIAILGDFQGMGDQNADHDAPLHERRPAQVDRDNLDQVLGQFHPGARIPMPDGTSAVLRFTELDDFHPDRLYQQLPLFARLRRLRRELADPATFAKARERPAAPAPAQGPMAIPGSLLDQIVGESPSEDGEDLHSFIERIVAPHLVPNVAPAQTALLAQVDAAIGALLRLALHHPAFQQIESLWRSVSLLTRRIETGADLQIYLLNVSQPELRRDLSSDGTAEDSGIFRLLSDTSDTLGGPWGLLVGAYTFGDREGDVQVLGRIASIAASLGTPWISAAHPRLLGCPDVELLMEPARWEGTSSSEWASLRRAPEAKWLGLVLPRFLVRLPYGAGSDECEQLAFEELTQPVDHEEFLWGNSALTCALLLAQSFEAAGWKLKPGMHREVSGLPLYLRRDNGATIATPCAEVLLTDTVAEHLLDQGIMPLVSRKDDDTVQLIRFQSTAHPPAPLAGRWQQGQA